MGESGLPWLKWFNIASRSVTEMRPARSYSTEYIGIFLFLRISPTILAKPLAFLESSASEPGRAITHASSGGICSVYSQPNGQSLLFLTRLPNLMCDSSAIFDSFLTIYQNLSAMARGKAK